MNFFFDRIACLNIRRSLEKEWLITNGKGDYASGTVPHCNTRKYHGLLVANLTNPPGRHVLLSTMEESLLGADKEFFFSTRKHPQVYYPRGHEYLYSVMVEDWPTFTYRIGDVTVVRELVLVHQRSLLLFKYTVHSDNAVPALSLRLKPLLAYRHFHSLMHANEHVQKNTENLTNGVCFTPYATMPPLYMQSKNSFTFSSAPDWYYAVEYFVEAERGFPAQEDLFMPGIINIPVNMHEPIYVSASTELIQEDLEVLWNKEITARRALCPKTNTVFDQLRRKGASFMVKPENETVEVLAGYHWFDAWGRDTLIALPGLTFCAGRATKGARILEAVTHSIRDGLVPNCFGRNQDEHAYNSVDAALWYIWAVQKLLEHYPGREAWIYETHWASIRSIITAYMSGIHAHIFMDEDGLLHTGTEQTQLTWMDAQVRGKPVTPRHGCAVEINALWYNALAFAEYLGSLFGDTPPMADHTLRHMRHVFQERFWIEREGGYLGDTWRQGSLDDSIRPNQIFAVSLPYPIIQEDLQAQVVECVRNKLLTPYGLRTLAPDHPNYCPVYRGTPEERDSAYHQGTVWPWLLGAYTEALLRTVWDTEGAVQGLLDTLTPLFSQHFWDAGLGTFSEIFDGSPPHRPDGCIAQAWSVAECLRSLDMLQKAAPHVYTAWELSLR